jgi:hypothetical protein
MTQPSAAKPLRVRLPCVDAEDYRLRFADAIAERGIAIPAATLLPVSTRVRVVLELTGGGEVAGDAVVAEHTELRGRPAMKARFLRMDPPPGPKRAASPAAAEAPLTTPVPRAAPAKPLADELFDGGETDFSSLLEDDAPAPAPARRPATKPLGALAGMKAASAAPPPAALSPALTPAPSGRAAEAATAAAPEEEPGHAGAFDDGARISPSDEPTVLVPPPPPTTAPPRARPPPKRHPVVAIAAALVVVVVAAAAAVVVVRRPSGKPASAEGPGMSPAVVKHVETADRALSEGRLVGAGAAVEHLVAARALAPGEVSIHERLRLLADTLESFGAAAAARGDLDEARRHLEAAAEADPGRASVRARLAKLDRHHGIAVPVKNAERKR